MTPQLQTVTWRQSVAAVVAVGLALAGLVIVLRSEGLPAVNAASSRATRWVVHEPTGRVVLVDGFGGRALASLDLNASGDELLVAEGPGGTYVLDDSTAEVRTVDAADLRLGAPLALAALGDGVAVARSGPSGLIVANPATGVATLVTNDEPIDISFDADNGPGVDTTNTVALAPDGSIWSLVDGALERASSSAATAENLRLGDAVLSLVNNEPLVLDRELNRVRLGSGEWQRLPSEIDGSELVIQRPGPAAACGWVGGGDELWCVSSDGIEESVTIPGLAIGGGDILAIAGDAAALVRRGPTEVVQFDWRTEEILDEQPLTVPARTQLGVTSTNDVIWIDEVSGDFVWSVHPWGIEAIDKNGFGLFIVDDEGTVLEEGDSDAGEAAGADDGVAIEPEARDPDNNGIDDPPIAVDDPVTARSGASVPVAVTANDYDPDGEAIAVSDVGTPGHGTVEVGTASTVIYTPDSGYVGVDEFEYTIVDGDGTEATASVIVDLLPADGTNRAPVGAPDESETGSGVPVVVDVLLNDVDPERDGLRLDSFSAEPDIGDVNETEGLSGLPALEYSPVEGFEGTARFSYRPVDTFGAVGEPVEVTVDVARTGGENRSPVVAPDSVRTRRFSEAIVPVLVNDSDPDGDPLVLSVVRPLPDGIDVEIQGDQLAVTPLAGSGESVTFDYEVDDGQGNQVRGPVLVSVIDESEPNRPPVVSPDIETVVFGQTILIDVTANDSDPDGDPLAVTAISQPDGGGTTASGGRNQIEFTPSVIDDEEAANVRFTYTVSDGNGHEVVGDVTVTVLAEPLPEPPYARDDSTFTVVNDPVTIDVLRNDGDPSGERPTIVGTPGCPTGGTATVTADSQVRFDPPPGSSGAFRCSYEVTNSQNLRDSAAIIISVREPETGNNEPITLLDTDTIDVGESVSRDVTANDIDPDGDSSLLRVTSLNQPPFGSATRNGNIITFSADSTIGVATITYQVEDSEGALATGRFQITVTEAENVAPIAVPDTRQIVGPGVQQTFDVLANDRDPDDSPGGLTVTSAQLIEGAGSLSQSGSQVTITAPLDFEGVLVGAYSIRDGEGATASSTVTLTVTPPANRPPVAGDDNASVANGGSVTIPVLQNDSDPDGDSLIVSIVSGPDESLGSASVTGDQSITFQAREGQEGVASITYLASDGELTDTATALVTVASCQASQPAAADAFLTTGYQVPIAVNLADYSANGDVINVTGPPGYANGVYTPPAGENGNVTIGYGVRNRCDQEANGTITIDVNQSPSGQDNSVTLSRGASAEIPVGQLGSDDEALIISGSAGAPGWVTTSAGGLQIAVPDDEAFGTTSWTTTIADPGGLTATVSVSVTVSNGVPVAVGDSIDASSGDGTTDLLANDRDPGDPGSELTIQSIPATVAFDGGGTGAITRSGGEVTVTTTDGTGLGSFTYTIVDADGAVSNAATVTVTGPPVATTTTTPPTTTPPTTTPPTTTPPTTTTTLPTTTTSTEPDSNTAPVAKNQRVSVVAGTETTVDLKVSDADGDELTVTDVSDPTRVASISGLTMIIVAPNAGTFTVTYRVTDGTDRSGSATVTIDASTAATTTTSTTTTSTTTTTTLPVPPTTSPPDPPPGDG